MSKLDRKAIGSLDFDEYLTLIEKDYETQNEILSNASTTKRKFSIPKQKPKSKSFLRQNSAYRH
jgi:hypothetical protein